MGIDEFLLDPMNVRQINAAIRRALEGQRNGEGPLAQILVVDDDPLFRRMLTQTLAREKHNVLSATSGGEALAFLRSDPPVDLVIADIDMSQVDGLEIITTVRRGSSVPILAISANTGRDGRLGLAAVLGADRTLVRPFDHEQLLEAVRSLVQA